MTKNLYIFIAACLLVATSASNVQMWKCLISGDILLDPTCEFIEVEEESCCSQKATDSKAFLAEDNCCEKLYSATSFDLDNVNARKASKLTKNYTLAVNLATQNTPAYFIKARINYFHNLPPPYPKVRELASFLTNCSFLC
ncbi:MAG: hypothetical protein NE334_19635 [Lentisphaeraceae bacterium]|nr:hypothetical protein [Lentisphaeraceae bacterium]